MALPSSGPISLSDIQAEFGGSNPISLSEYYAGGAYVPAGTSGTYGAVPSSGAISTRNFYGTAKATRVSLNYTFSSNTENASLNVTSISGYSAGLSDITITVNSGIYLWSSSTSTAGLTLSGGTTGDTITLVNNGYIMGQGGNAAGYDGNYVNPTAGGPALSLGFNTTVNNTNGSAYIGGGGGGGAAGYFTEGGGGAGGGGGGYYGTGPSAAQPGAVGGSIGNSGAIGTTSVYTIFYGGGAGGRIFPGTGGAGNTGTPDIGVGYGGGAGGGGGQSNTTKPYVTYQGGGGGGWGASGGSGSYIPGAVGSAGNGGSANASGGNASGTITNTGAAGGKAVALNGYSITWTSGNTTRVYGAVA